LPSLRRCPTCGETIPPSTGECLYCTAVESAAEAPPAAAPAAAPPSVGDGERAFGLLLFEAEECLARGQGDKATVLASRAMRERPDSLIARALYERSRRELLQGRRREKLESRVQEAQGLLDRGELDAANRIVTSALKLIPDHAVALALFGAIKERRQASGSAAAEAERELQRLDRLQARQALAAARAALDAGWERRALGALRRGLRLVPDDPDLLALLKRVQTAGAELDRETAERRALPPPVRVGLDLLAHGRLQQSLAVLRAALKEDPDNARAQAAVQDVRHAWLARAAAAPATPASPPPPPVTARPPSSLTPRPAAPPAKATALARAELPRPSARTGPRTVYPSGPRKIPGEILLPRTRRRATPMRFILVGGAGVFVLIAALYFAGRPDALPPPTLDRPPTAVPPTAATPSPAVEPDGPLAQADPELRATIRDVLAGYGRALETQDAPLLASVRPDLAADERQRMLARFTGALNVGIDLRVLDAAFTSAEAVVTVLRTEVVVGGRGGDTPPEEETLRFEKRPEGWILGARRR
jgi:tetratricopeptide (TPR) repeat protein